VERETEKSGTSTLFHIDPKGPLFSRAAPFVKRPEFHVQPIPAKSVPFVAQVSHGNRPLSAPISNLGCPLKITPRFVGQNTFFADPVHAQTVPRLGNLAQNQGR
jgi:hypothetical protein